VLEAYFDESGAHEGSRVFSIGGLVARQKQWMIFTNKWRAALKEGGAEEFHASDLENLQGIYAGWNEEQKRRLLQAASKIIASFSRNAVAGLVIVDDYEGAVPQWAKKTAAFGDKYNFCFQICVGLVLSWIEHLNPPMPKGNLVSFVFDQRNRGEEITSNTYTQIKNFRDPEDRMGALAFDSRKRLLPLQAADFVAYETYKHLDNIVSCSGRPPRGSFSFLLKSGCNVRGHYFGRERLTELIQHYESTKGRSGMEPWWPWFSPVTEPSGRK